MIQGISLTLFKEVQCHSKRHVTIIENISKAYVKNRTQTLYRCRKLTKIENTKESISITNYFILKK